LNHPDRFKQQQDEQNKKQREKNGDKMKAQQKEYNNSEAGKAKRTEYREKNLQLIKEKAKERVICECGESIIKNTKYRHIKSQKHIDALKL
jgi:hypothetical protein